MAGIKNALQQSTTENAVGDHYEEMTTLARELHDDHATSTTLQDELIETLNELITETRRDQVVYSASPGAGAGIDVDDGGAQDIETNNAIVIQKNGLRYPVAVDAAFDISAAATCAGDTVAQSKSGVAWVFADISGNLDMETDTAAQAYDSAIEAWAAYSTASNTLPVASDEVAIGAVLVTEGGSGAFTWGDDSISAETETFVSFEGLPGVHSAAASFALDAAAATFTYGAATVRLGDGTVVSATGKANVTISGSNVADGAAGAWLFYVQADDVEHAEQLGAAYADLATAQAAVRDHLPNPYLPLVGVIYVENDSGANFVPGTTNLDATGITATFTTIGPGSAHLEVGRAQLGQPHQVLQNAAQSTLTADKPDDV